MRWTEVESRQGQDAWGKAGHQCKETDAEGQRQSCWETEAGSNTHLSPEGGSRLRSRWMKQVQG